MSKFRKILVILLIIGSAAIAYATFGPEKISPEFREVPVEKAQAEELNSFAEKLFTLAHRSTPRKFGRYCFNVNDPYLSLFYRELKGYDLQGWNVTKYSRIAGQPDSCQLHITNGKQEDAIMTCRRGKDNTWKFVNFTTENTDLSEFSN